MDPSIVKFLDDDEDDSMHAGADVEAFSASLTRDIGGDPSSTCQPPDSALGMNCQGGTSASHELLEQWRACNQAENTVAKIEQKEEQHLQPFEHHLSRMEQTEHDLHVSEKDKQTESHREKCQPLKQEGPSHSDHQLSAEKNPTLTVEKEEMEITDKILALSEKQENAQPSISQHLHSSQQLNVPQSAVTNETNNSHNFQNLNVQQPQVSNEASNSGSRSKAMPTISFHMLIPILRPHLDKDRSMQLQAIFSKLRGNEVSKEDFIRVIRNIVGDQMLRQAAQKLQVQLQAQANRNPQTNPNPYSLQNQKGHKSPPHQPHVPIPILQRQSDTSFLTPNNGNQMSQEVEKRLEVKGMHAGQMHSPGLNAINQEREGAMSLHAVNKQPQHSQMPQSFPMYGVTASSFHSHSYPRPSIGSEETAQKSQVQDSQTRHALHAQGIAATQLGSSQLMSMAHTSKYEIHNTGSETKKSHVGSLANHPLSQQRSVALQNFQASEPPGPVPTGADGTIQISSATSLTAGNSTKTPHKKSSTGQKKSLEAPGTSPPPSSKKQKTSGAFHDQSIDQLNDVTAVSGVNLREEEEQLLCAPKEESRASEAARRAVQEEEETLILLRGPLQRKLEQITSKCGLRNIGSDVERCLSMCVEERLRGLLSYLIRLSKQRVDIEKSRHRFVVTSDVGRQILSINRKMKEDWDKRQANEAEKLRKSNDSDGITGAEAEKDKEKDKEKDEVRLKAPKINKEEDDKMRTTAANVAARAAVGGDDMLSKWQLMAEQARQKREGLDSASQATKTANNKSSPAFQKHEHHESERKETSALLSGSSKKTSRIHQSGTPQIKMSHSISLKDVISALEREPQMSKSTLIYRLFERNAANTVVEQLS